MDGEGKHRTVVAKNVRRAVAMMDVGVHDDGLFYDALRLETADSDSDVMNRAESFAVVGVRMMETPAQVAGKAIAKSQLARENRTAGGQPDSLHEFGRIRHFELHDFAGGQRAVPELADPFRRVHPKEVLVSGQSGLNEVFPQGDAIAQKEFMDEAELLRRK